MNGLRVREMRPSPEPTHTDAVASVGQPGVRPHLPGVQESIHSPHAQKYGREH